MRINPTTQEFWRHGWRLPAAGLLAVAIFLPVGAACQHDLQKAWAGWDAEEPLFVFATIADSHIRDYPADDVVYLKALSIAGPLLANYVHDINWHEPPVDFTVHLGDLTDRSNAWEYEAARSILDSLQSALFPVAGNHDNYQSDGKEAWKRFAGLDSTHYSFDYLGYHFVVIDCTMDPYEPPYVDCTDRLRRWVAGDLAENPDTPTIIFSHFNMWRRQWGEKFDSIGCYEEYRGMPELRRVLDEAGSVVAVINGHVHANRVETHNGIHYIDIGATLVGRPSIRYFHVYSDSIRVDYAYISDDRLLRQVEKLARQCASCVDPERMPDFIDGTDADKRFTIPVGVP